MTERVALRERLERDLKGFSRLLWQAGLPHRISEERGEQVVWVAGEDEAEQVRALYQRFNDGELAAVEIADAPVAAKRGLSRHNLAALPVLAVLLLLSVCGGVLAWLDRDFQWLTWLSFYKLSIFNGQLMGEWPSDQPWRIITPIFLHFGLLHLAFNSLWLWELGGMIERRQGSLRMIAIVVLVGAGSNIAQAMVGVSLFGGMSGVIYGLLGYILAWNKLAPSRPFPLVPGVAIAMLIWLGLCVVGFASLLGAGDIANTAHISGLILGLVLGAAAGWFSRRASV